MQRHKVPFVLASTVHGPTIVHRLDWQSLSKTHTEVGVGLDLLLNGEYDLAQVSMTLGAIEARRLAHGPGVVALDCGANVGVYTMEWARAMEGWGSVIAFEPQERLYYALAGNLALNNLFNARALNKAVGSVCGSIEVPMIDYGVPRHVSALSLKGEEQGIPVELVTIDSLALPRLDFLKLDIEGMEMEALEGARDTIRRSFPFILAEWHLVGRKPMTDFMESVGYQTAFMGMNVFAGPPCDVMSRFIELSKTTDVLDVGHSGQDIRKGANGSTRTGQQDGVGIAG